MESIRTARKDYTCDFCQGVIRKGNRYGHSSYRNPRFDSSFEKQIGIEYNTFRCHNYYCGGKLIGMEIANAKNVINNCNKGIHNPVEEQVIDDYVGGHAVGVPTGEYFCEWCGIKLTPPK